MKLNANIPSGPLAQKWTNHKHEIRLVNPSNKRKYEIIVVGTGLSGASAAASLAELGYNIKSFCIQDSARRAHSVAAQGGINAAKNYRNDGDNVYRLFYDTLKGGDFRAREANVYRLAEVSVNVIDQAVAQGVPFAREYSGYLATRSFGGAQVSRTFYARGQTGQQLLLGAYQALSHQISLGAVKMFPRQEMLELIVVNGHAKGIVVRDLISGKISSVMADAVVLASGGYTNVFCLCTSGGASNATAAWRAHRKGALFANPCFTQIHPTCIPVSGDYQSKLTLMSESLRNDGRVWVPKTANDKRPPQDIPDSERDYYLERTYPAYGNLVPRDIASRAAKRVCDEGRGVGTTGLGVYLDFRDAIARFGGEVVKERYGNLFEMYREITAEDAYKTPMRIYPAIHYAMGGLWVDYNLMSNLPGLFVIGEANFADHGANRLGASALMQGLSDGYFILPYTIGDYLARNGVKRPSADVPEAKLAEQETAQRLNKLLSIRGKRTPVEFHKQLGKILWEHCGMARQEAGLKTAIQQIAALRDEFWQNVIVPGSHQDLNMALERAGRVADFLELGELICLDALTRAESCGCHFRTEFQTPEGECLRNDAEYACVAAWEFGGPGKPSQLHKEPLVYEEAHMAQRSYK
ncbi:MAG: fumarate reductase/succinate dehydrogenase flavoprotein subunit [Verrucomicrobiia bacterium]|jgi:succinate dehydrogenase / fumarate reductase flavoprotein subunit